MGLDVTAYRNAVLSDIESDDEFEFHDEKWNFKAWVPFEGFKGRIAALKDGGYYLGESVGNLGYAYSSHYHFRLTLLKILGLVDINATDIDWKCIAPGDSFYELIYFSDCEGTIDYKTCAKLYDDFARNEPLAMNFFQKYSEYEDKYFEWMEMCRLASDNGALSFH